MARLHHFTGLEASDQFAPRAMNPGPYRSDRALQRFSDFGVAQFMLVKQQERLSVLFAQRTQGQGDFFGQLSGGLHIGRSSRYGLDQRSSRRFSHPTRQRCAAAVSRNRQQPRFEIPFGIPTPQISQRPHKRLLGSVFGIFPVSQHPVAEPKHLSAKSIDQIDHGLLVTGQTAAYQLAEVVGQLCTLDPKGLYSGEYSSAVP